MTQYRVYDPRTARWLSRDPIEENGGINLYGYVGGNPVNLSDPKGLNPATGAIEGGIIGAEAGTTIFPGPGTIIGGVVGARVGAGAGIILASEISDILDEIMDELEKKKKAESEANCPPNNDERCKEVLQNCRAQCTDTFVDDPNKLPGSGSDMFGRIRQCIRECMVNNGCNNF